MAGHSQFKNIMYRKGAQDAKKAKQFTKLAREIIVAVKAGGSDPEFNPRLRRVLMSAREANLPKSRIESAISKALSPAESDNFEEIIYECYLPNGVALVVETLTDNRNRTSNEIRSLLTKNGGSLATEGSVLYLFDRLGLIELDSASIPDDVAFEAAIEAGGTDCVSLPDEKVHQIFCNREALHEVQSYLAKKFGEPKSARLLWRPKIELEVNTEAAKHLMEVIDALEDLDDVQNVYGNYTCSN